MTQADTEKNGPEGGTSVTSHRSSEGRRASCKPNGGEESVTSHRGSSFCGHAYFPGQSSERKPAGHIRPYLRSPWSSTRCNPVLPHIVVHQVQQEAWDWKKDLKGLRNLASEKTNGSMGLEEGPEGPSKFGLNEHQEGHSLFRR
ncbi:uncharacterized protein LOC135369434 [Ornithodoros turicata]|uniref:uncharacterized protein LOC135369434 n=1 Tax=Ornithodoros turicata TaxID=34597 RepID=UPI0031388513